MASESSVGAERLFSRSYRPNSLPDILKKHAASHGGNKGDDARRQRRKTF
jgi:hypothetical protein